MNVIRNIYLFREEIIVKLLEFLTQIERVTINKTIHSQFSNLCKYIGERQLDLDKIEMKILRRQNVQVSQFLLKINEEYETYIINKQFGQRSIINTYLEKNQQQKQSNDTNYIIQIQKRCFALIMKNLTEFVLNWQQQQQKGNLDIFQYVEVFHSILIKDYELTRKCTDFYFKINSKNFKQQSQMDNFKLLNIQKSQIQLPITNNKDFSYNIILSRNANIIISVKKYKQNYINYSQRKLQNKNNLINKQTIQRKEQSIISFQKLKAQQIKKPINQSRILTANSFYLNFTKNEKQQQKFQQNYKTTLLPNNPTDENYSKCYSTHKNQKEINQINLITLKSISRINNVEKNYLIQQNTETNYQKILNQTYKLQNESNSTLNPTNSNNNFPSRIKKFNKRKHYF